MRPLATPNGYACSKCQALLVAGAMFCSECGAGMSFRIPSFGAAAKAPTAEPVTREIHNAPDEQMIRELARQYADAVRSVKAGVWTTAFIGPFGAMPALSAEQRINNIRQTVAGLGMSLSQFEDIALGPGRTYRRGGCASGVLVIVLALCLATILLRLIS
jgi:hypothetical protein